MSSFPTSSANLSASTTPMLRPPYDPLLSEKAREMSAPVPKELDIQKFRSNNDLFSATTVSQNCPDMAQAEFEVPGLSEHDSPITISVFSRKQSTSKGRPMVYFIHGGGQVGGNRFVAADVCIKYFDGIDIVFVSVEYRVAPEHPAPAALDDSYAGLLWAIKQAEILGIDPQQVMILGGSGGAPIALGCSLRCRGKPYPLAQMILTPMLDDRNDTVSAKQYARDGPWCGTMNSMAWDLVLGQKARGGPNVDSLLAPARMTDLEGLPPTFLDAGACEVFRDEAVTLASRLWACGVSAELHVWPGAFHGFDVICPDAPVSKNSQQAKVNWIQRMIQGHRT